MAFSYNDSKVFKFVLLKLAFFRFEIEVVFLQFVQHLVNVFSVASSMLFFHFMGVSGCVDCDVIHVY